MSFYEKYLKYKNKYLALKLEQKGGGEEYEMSLKKIWFDYIRNGQKTIEGRLYDGKRKLLQVGDTIKFTNGEDSFTKEITNLETYDTFKDAINDDNFMQLIPNASNKEEALKVYDDIYHDIIRQKNHMDGIILIYFE